MKNKIKEKMKNDKLFADVMLYIADTHYCPKSYGFEGVDTFTACGECITCIAIEICHNYEA